VVDDLRQPAQIEDTVTPDQDMVVRQHVAGRSGGEQLGPTSLLAAQHLVRLAPPYPADLDASHENRA
jgi:hypothetical protein